MAHTHASRRAMLGSLRFKALNVLGGGLPGKRGHYGAGLRSPAQGARQMNRGSSGIHLTFIPAV